MSDDHNRAFSDALSADWPNDRTAAETTVGTLAGLVSTWRGRACYWRGKHEEQAAVVEALKGEIKWLRKITGTFS